MWQYVGKAVDCQQPFVGIFLRNLVLPYRMMGNVDGISAELQHGTDVGAERIAHHQQLVNLAAEPTAQPTISLRCLVGNYHDVIEIAFQT